MERSVRRRERRRPRVDGGVHVQASPADASAEEVVSSGLIGELRQVRVAVVHRTDQRSGERADASRARRRRLDGPRLLLRQRRPHARRRAGRRVRPAGPWARRASTSASRAAAVLRRRPRRDRLRLRDAVRRRASRRSVPRARPSCAKPWTCQDPAIVLRRGDTVERVEVEDDDRYRLQLENMSGAIRGEAEPLLGRSDALGQARTIAGALPVGRNASESPARAN